MDIKNKTQSKRIDQKPKEIKRKSLGNVLSLFDGIGTGAMALFEGGFYSEKYYSSEINPDAIAIALRNSLNTPLGDVRNLTKDKLTQLGKIDLLIGGSPCQDFSLAGTQRGMVTETKVEVKDLDTYMKLKKDNFVFKGESYLFWEYIRIMKIVKPKYFLLENVIMSSKWRDIITNELGVEPVVLNSANVSAQQRKRNYWFNWDLKFEIPNCHQHVIDILDPEIEAQKKIHSIYKPKEWYHPQFDNRYVLSDSPKRIGTIGGKGQAHRIFSVYGKSPVITGSIGGQGSRTGLYWIESGGQLGPYVRYLTVNEAERLQTLPTDLTKYGFYGSDIFRISDFKRGRVIGLGWTKDVIKYIFQNLRYNL